MLAIDGSFLDFKQLDLLALRQTAVHRLDPRAKVLTTLCFIVCVVSFDKYQISAMLPFLIYPVALIAKLKKSVPGQEEVLLMALGWLAREDQLDFTQRGRSVRIALRRPD